VLLHAYHLPVDFQQLEGAYLPPDFWKQVKTEPPRISRAVRRNCASADSRWRRWCARATGDVIEDEARSRHADLVVIGTRGHSGLKHLLLAAWPNEWCRRRRVPCSR